MAWQQLEFQDKFQLEIPKEAKFASSIIENLRSIKCKEKDLDQSVFYAAGIKSAIAANLNRDLQEKFPRFKTAKVSKKGQEVIFYGAMYKFLELKYPFYKIDGKIMHFRKLKVPCFEPIQEKQRSQVFVLNYTNQDNFFIRINLKEKGSQMYVLMSSIKISLEQIFQMVKKSNDDAQPITKQDIFKIPQIKIDVSHSLSDVSGLKMKYKRDDQKYQILPMEQHVMLSMPGSIQQDKLEDLTLTVPEFQTPRLKQRRMCLNNPFWIVLRNKGCHPYYAMFLNKPIETE